MEEKGLIVIYLEKLFGKSWRTAACGILIILPQILNAIQAWMLDIGASPSTMNSLSLLAAAIAALVAKDSQVVGTNRPTGTGEPGKET